MAKRKINLQNIGESSPSEQIDEMVRGFGTANLGFSPTGQSIYEVDLDRVYPDPNQPRCILPGELRNRVNNRELQPVDAIRELIQRAKNNDPLALLILGGAEDTSDDDEDHGLRALANSIKSVGLRQPINVYSVASSDIPGETNYQIAEGERRYWAHQLLVAEGHREFLRIRCMIEPMPDDEELIRRRQQAENAARQDLSAIARARSIQQIRDRLRIEMGTRVPGESTIKLPSQRELDAAVGQEVKIFSGRAIGGRMVRNYLRLLKLPSDLQDIAEAAQLTEKQLRPIMGLSTMAEQRRVLMQIVERRLSGRAIEELVKPSAATRAVGRTVTTIEQRLERRLYQTARTVLGLAESSDYGQFVADLAERLAKSAVVRDEFVAMHQLLEDVLSLVDDKRPR